ncbi:tetratricopeptide repeat protein [Desulfobacterales bacterium HSG17]|nr:tetratricopeptide repeat protein [Desulfobacterales bacterium HSG17]
MKRIDIGVRPILFFLLIVVLIALSACRVQNVITGQYYLDTENYKEGIPKFESIVAQSPESAKARYFLARFYLGDNLPEKALPHFEKAVALSPGETDYHFWLGIAQGALKQLGAERKSYQKALAISPKHVGALAYLGHSYLQEGDFKNALVQYDKALKGYPFYAQVLYNRALAYEKIGQIAKAIKAYEAYLKLYKSGSNARRATWNLNRKGNFNYRNFLIGKRTITIESIAFKPETDVLTDDAKDSLEFLGHLMKKGKNLTLQVILYHKDNKALAKKRALAIKKHVVEFTTGLTGDRVGISWFDQPEAMRVDGKKFYLDESVKFFTTSKDVV